MWTVVHISSHTMEHIAPLIQTILWVGFIGTIFWRFHTPIYGLLMALQKRVETGSSVRAGPFEITDQLKPQDPKTQKEKTAVEVEEALQAESQLPQAVSSPTECIASVQARYFQAEDLVLRAI